MERHRVELLLEAEQPISHLAETFGNTGILATRKIRQQDGAIASVPEVSGDAMRHGLREAAAYVLLRAAELEGQLSEAALRLLFAGGMVTGRGDGNTVRLGEYRRMVDLVPALALLGGCAENRTIPGRLCVDPATLVCAESTRFLPPWMAEDPRCAAAMAETYRASVEEVQRVRMDPSLDPGKRALLEPGALDGIERRLEASERASREGDAVAKDAAKSSMMPRRYERLIEGSLFYWTVTADLHSALDVDTFYTMLLAFAGNIVVAGKRSTGHGRMRVVAARRTVLADPTALPAPEEVGLVALRDAGVGRVFLDHVRERAAKVREYLNGVNA